jgi:type I restriction enzyme S subunit
MSSKIWKSVQIKDIAEINPDSISPKTSKNTLINYIDLESVKNGKILAIKEMQFRDAPSRAKRVVKKGDVLFSTVRPYLKNFTIIENEQENLIASTGFAILRAKENSDAGFIYQTLYSDIFMNQIIIEMKGSNYPAVNASDVEKVEILLPTIEEQQKIASILTTVDKHIDETEQLIVKTQELKKGLMQQLLTKGIGHTEFKQTELGEIPFNWKVKKLGECLDVLGGYAFKSKDAKEAGIPWLKIANVGLGKIKWDDTSFLPIDYLEKYSEYQIRYGDIVMAMTRPILNGKVKIAVYQDEQASLLNQRVCKFEILNGIIEKSYFYQVANMREFIQNIEYLIAGTDPPNVSAQQIKNVLIRLPDLEEQQKIAQILSTVDEQIEIYEQEKAKYEELKKGLMQQLLTGQIRVKI